MKTKGTALRCHTYRPIRSECRTFYVRPIVNVCDTVYGSIGNSIPLVVVNNRNELVRPLWRTNIFKLASRRGSEKTGMGDDVGDGRKEKGKCFAGLSHAMHVLVASKYDEKHKLPANYDAKRQDATNALHSSIHSHTSWLCVCVCACDATQFEALHV